MSSLADGYFIKRKESVFTIPALNEEGNTNVSMSFKYDQLMLKAQINLVFRGTF